MIFQQFFNKKINQTFLLFGLIFILIVFSGSSFASKLNEPEVDRTPAGKNWWAAIWSPDATAEEIYSYIKKNRYSSSDWQPFKFDGRDVVLLRQKGHINEVKSDLWLRYGGGLYDGPSPHERLQRREIIDEKALVDKMKEKIKIEVVYIPNVVGAPNVPSTISVPQFQTNKNVEIRLANGDVYFGQVKDGKPNGQGTYTWANGESFSGEWKDGQRNGQGTLTIKQYGGLYSGEKQYGGGLYVGEFKDDKYNGQGTLLLKDGTNQVGIFKDGKYVGP